VQLGRFARRSGRFPAAGAGIVAGYVAKGLVRADAVVDLCPVRELTIEFFHSQGTGRNLVELLAVDTVGTFNGTIPAGGQRVSERSNPEW
jgi:hypothetical protein